MKKATDTITAIINANQVKHGLIFHVIELTPELAEEILSNPALQPAVSGITNRAVSAGTVARFSKAIESGEWWLNGEPIIFDKYGARLNGEHRLRAVIAAGEAITTAVVIGVETATFSTMDSGKPRTAGDVLSITGKKNSACLSACAGWVQRYDLGVMSDYHLPFASRGELVAFVESDLEAMSDAVQTTLSMSKTNNFRILPPSPMAAVMYLTRQSNQVSRERVDEFWDSLCTATNIQPGSGLAACYRYLNNARLSPKRAATHHLLAVVVKGFNAHVTDASVKLMRYTDDEPFPSIIGRAPKLASN